ncbi:MAG: DsrE family protein [Desulfobacterales bacterium]|nr:DsrE family protein [Desulfobacterales bacterium]
MQRAWKRIILAAVLVLLSTHMLSATPIPKQERLFINLTSDTEYRAKMAFFLGTKFLEAEEMPVTVFLNVDAVRIALKQTPHPELQVKLKVFLSAGGRVLICPMCLKKVAGASNNDFIKGIQVATVENVTYEMFKNGTRILSY